MLASQPHPIDCRTCTTGFAGTAISKRGALGDVAPPPASISTTSTRELHSHVLPIPPLVVPLQGMHQVATLALCEVMDAMSLSAEASQLELSLGAYWEPTDEENREAAELSGMQVCGRVRACVWV